MSRDDIGHYVRGELHTIFEQHPKYLFYQAAEVLYEKIPDVYLSRLLLTSDAVGTFDSLHELLFLHKQLSARNIVRAVVKDIFRIYALEDPDLRIKATA